MPIFFILSGFSLSVIYGDKINNNFKKKNFYRNRFDRIYPVYIVTLIFALLLKFTDFGGPKKYIDDSISKWILKVIANMVLVNRWLFPLPISFPINGPSWFLGNLSFYYVIFPYSIQFYKRVKRRILWVVFHSLLTAFISTFLMIKLNFVVATTNLISPGFFMFHTGILCGFWCKEKTLDINQKSNNMINEIQMKWSKSADISTLLLFSWLFISTILQAVFGIKYRANFVIQTYGTPLMIIMIISLTLDGGKSRIAKLCRHDASKFLGKISMSLYLVHYPLLQYFCVILKHIAPNLLNLTDYKLKMLHCGTMPWYGVFVNVPISLIAACVLEVVVETPC